jgi:hypothetical protein
VLYAKAFIDLQLDFAETVASLAAMPIARAVLAYTNLYVRFGLGRDFDPQHPIWRDYLAGLHETNHRREWTYRFYLTRPHAVPPPGLVATFGCFAYARLSDDRIRLHFDNAETDGRSPLSRECQRRRIADLKALFAYVRRAERESVTVVGASWLYNLDAYRRLFPASFLATARVTPPRFQHMPLWGQFVDRRGDVKDGAARELRERLARQANLDGLDRCFPFPVLRLEAPVLTFYEWYGV